MLDLVLGNGPFDRPQADASTFSDEKHLAHIISVLGPPPLDMLRQAKNSSRYFDAEGIVSFPCYLISKLFLLILKQGSLSIRNLSQRAEDLIASFPASKIVMINTHFSIWYRGCCGGDQMIEALRKVYSRILGFKSDYSVGSFNSLQHGWW